MDTSGSQATLIDCLLDGSSQEKEAEEIHCTNRKFEEGKAHRETLKETTYTVICMLKEHESSNALQATKAGSKHTSGMQSG
jgi:hypothetical protein